MKINLLLLIVFISFTLTAIDSDEIERIGGTQLNGNGCVCHTTIASPNVHVWIEGPDTMVSGQSAVYRMYMFGGLAIAGGYNVAVRFGLLDTLDTLSVLIDNELTQNFSLPFQSTSDTIFWSFLYTAPDSINYDTLYSVGLSTNWDSIPDDRDQWAYGPKFPVRIIENIVPVELLSFKAELAGNIVALSWSTCVEKNNKGFEVERKGHNLQSSVGKWETVGFVNGKGTSSQKSQYSFVDKSLNVGKYFYRLKQIDFDGTFKFYDLGEIIEVTSPGKFELFQNFPNPFNPSTKIIYSVACAGAQCIVPVQLKVYDVLGNEVTTLVNEFKEAGSYEVVLKSPVGGQHFTSGVYYYQLRVGTFVETKKMIYLR